MKIKLLVNGTVYKLDVDPEAKLLWIIRDELKLTGTKYGCGVASCGACMVHVNGVSTFSCQMPVRLMEGKSITTIEGLSDDVSHPIQKAWLDGQVPQCGYCQSGQIMRAAHLLTVNPSPTRDEIVSHMSTNLCRCGTYPRIIKAIETAAEKMETNNG